MPLHLSSLEVHGFKTFANQTAFKFPGMVTAIVGPNGSGKSNIADSIRWVLGEQSYLSLRAKKTEDMIFSGSDQRSKAGLASVSITFNNEDNWLPIDYSEVVLTRRAFRDGQNEYLINNQKVRLKDIHELLSQTGLGDRTYTIIGQGLVDVALAIKPDERRRLFEEAAGIGLYRERKIETLKRLDTTRRNLDRVLDILTEIKPRLRNLERQSKKVIEFKRLQADLKVLLLDWYGYHWVKAQDELHTTQQLFNTQMNQTEDIRRKLSLNLTDLEKIRTDLLKTRNELNAIHSTSSEKHSEMEVVSRGLAIQDERKRASTSLKSQLEADISLLEVNILSIEDSKKLILDGFEKSKLELKDSELRYQEAKEQFDIISTQRTSINEDLIKIRENLVVSETSLITLRAKLNEINERVIDLKRSITQNAQSISDLDIKIDDLDTKKASLATELQKLNSQMLDLNKQIAVNSGEVNQLQEKETSLKKSLESIQQEKTRLGVQLDMIRQSEQALAGFSEGAKLLLRSVNQKKLNLNISAIINELVVPEKFETAIASVLGENIDILQLKDKAISNDVLTNIEANVTDRVAIISNSTKKPIKIGLSNLTSEKIIGKAIDLINFPSNLRGTLEILLGNVYVVTDRNDAVYLLSKISNTERIVTLKGEVFNGNGIVFMGKSSGSNKVGNPRKKIELVEKVESLNDEFAKKEELAHSLTAQLNSHEKASLSLEAEREELLSSLNSINIRLSDVDFEYKKNNDQRNWLKDQVQNLDIKIVDNSKLIVGLEESIQKATRDINGLKQQENVLKLKINDFPISDLQNKIHQYETDVVVCRQNFNNINDRISNINDRISQERERLRDLKSRFDDSERMLNSISIEEKQLHEKEQAVSKQLGELLLRNITPLEQKLKDLESLYAQRQKLESDLQKESIMKERQSSQIQLELSRKNERLEYLKERIEDDFGLVEFEYNPDMMSPTPLPFKDLVIESLPVRHELAKDLGENIKEMKVQLRRIGDINSEAQVEYLEVQERYNFLTEQVKDLETASVDLNKVINELEEIMQRDFLKTFKAVSVEFSRMFTRLFNGGTAKLLISDESDPIESGIDIEARLPGRREQGLVLLSGGERSLAAVALIFALLKVSPTPFCVLDEVDAMLDESNVGRFCDLLKELSVDTQFILITHNRNTVQIADVIYGVTMGRDSSSQVISLKLDEVDQTYIE